MDKILDVKDLRTAFFMDQGVVNAVNDVSFHVVPNETLGIVGESGCGKSVTARSVMGILGSRGRIVNGEILLYPAEDSGEVIDIAKLDFRGEKIRAIRGKDISMVFQEPMSTLSPVYTVGNQIIEAILLHQEQDRDRAREMALDAMRLVGIPRPEQRIDEYPHQLSGGMLQRCMIAMALSCRPRVLIADEPTTAIDVTTQAQILELMRDLQAELGMSIVMITHNLGVIAEMSERVIVMYMGKIVEAASVRELFKKPLHPYTRALFKSIPVLGDESHVKQRLEAIAGAVPDAYNIPTGCAFHPRCPEFIPGRCDKVVPAETEPSPGHTVLCHLFGREEADHG